MRRVSARDRLESALVAQPTGWTTWRALEPEHQQQLLAFIDGAWTPWFRAYRTGVIVRLLVAGPDALASWQQATGMPPSSWSDFISPI